MSRRGSELINGAIKSYTGAIVQQFDYGVHATGTTITFKHKFVSAPCVILSPAAASGMGTISLVSKDIDGDGFYTGATVVTSGCDYFDWIAVGTGIAA